MLPKNIDIELKNIIKQAGKLLLSYWHKKDLQKNKKKDNSLVTEADLASEQFLVSALQKLLPQADFFTEESGQFGTNNSGYCWVIDPLDGTRNFAAHIPYFCISVALTYQDKPIIGMIYNPLFDELFYAAEGKGAFCNDIKMAVSTPSSFAGSFITYGLSHNPQQRHKVLEATQKLIGTISAARHMGAVALDMANLAMGRFDGLICMYLSWWDVAAGALIIKEAGGTIGEIGGNPISPHFKSCVAGSAIIFDNLQQLFHNK